MSQRYLNILFKRLQSQASYWKESRYHVHVPRAQYVCQYAPVSDSLWEAAGDSSLLFIVWFSTVKGFFT